LAVVLEEPRFVVGLFASAALSVFGGAVSWRNGLVAVPCFILIAPVIEVNDECVGMLDEGMSYPVAA